MSDPRVFEVHRIEKRKGKHERHFEKNPHLRVEHEFFLHCSVKSPGGGDPERNPGEFSEGRDHEGDPGGRESDRGPLHAPEALGKEEDAQEHRNEGRQEGPDPELHDLFGDDPDHVDPPIQGRKDRGRKENPGATKVSPQRLHGAQNLPATPPHEQKRQHEDEGPDDAVGDHFPGIGRGQEIPVKRHETPEEVGDEGGGKAGFSVGTVGCRVRHGIGLRRECEEV